MKTKFLIVLLLLSSCVNPKDDIEGKRTYAGKLIYDRTEELLINNVNTLNLAKNADLYISAETLKEKYEIEDQFFKRVKIRFIDNVCTVISADYLCEIYPDGKSLKEVGSRWKVQFRYYYERMSVETYFVECSGVDHWVISAEDVRTILKDTLYETFRLDSKIVNAECRYSGSGSYSNSVYNHVAYEIVLPMTFNEKLKLFSMGNLSMAVRTNENRDETMVHCDLTESNARMIKNKITFRGITEMWFDSKPKNDFERLE